MSHPSLLVNNQEHVTFNLPISNHHNRNSSTTCLGQMDNLGTQHVWLSKTNATQIPCLLKKYMEAFCAPNAIITSLLVATPTKWLWFWTLKAQRNWQQSLFSEENSPLPHVRKLTVLPEAPWWIWGSQKLIQFWNEKTLNSSAFSCSVGLGGSIWYPH